MANPIQKYKGVSNEYCYKPNWQIGRASFKKGKLLTVHYCDLNGGMTHQKTKEGASSRQLPSWHPIKVTNSKQIQDVGHA